MSPSSRDKKSQASNGPRTRPEAAEQPPFFLLRNGKGPIHDFMDGSLRLQELTRGTQSEKLEVVIATAEPGFSCWEGKSRNGGRWYHILEGKLEIIADNIPHLLDEGDSIYIESELSHIWRNSSETTAKVLIICSPPATMLSRIGAYA